MEGSRESPEVLKIHMFHQLFHRVSTIFIHPLRCFAQYSISNHLVGSHDGLHGSTTMDPQTQ